MEILQIIFIWLALPLSLILTYLWTRRVGIYHVLNAFDSNGESKWVKFKLILNYNLYFSLIFALTIYITIKTLIPEIDIEKIAVMTIIVDYFLLLLQRVLTHPNQRLVDMIHNSCHHLERKEAVDNYRENLLSFFYAFINTSAVVSLLLETFNILTNKPLIIPDVSSGHADLLLIFIKIFLCFSLFLISVTLLGEACLLIIPPEYQKMHDGTDRIVKETNMVDIPHKCLYVFSSVIFLAVSWAIYTYL